MHSSAWIAILRRVPANHVDALALVMTTGIEIALQAILRFERDFVVIRGRTTGSSDAGRLLVVPFDQVQYLAFNRPLSDPELQSLLGPPGSLAAALAEVPPASAVPASVPVEALDFDALNAQLSASPLPATSSEPATAEPASAPSDAEPPVEAPPAATAKPAPVSKSILLARLRARLAKDHSSKSIR